MSEQKQYSESSETPDGQTSGGNMMLVVWSIVGVCLSVVIIVLATKALTLPNKLRQRTADKVFRAMMGQTDVNMRNMGMGLESYFVDNIAYPDQLYKLTTPIAYLREIPGDPFNGDYPLKCGITKTAKGEKGKPLIVFWSIGPDGYPDLDINRIDEFAGMYPDEPEKGFWDYTYDPTNGTDSDGDIIRFVKER